MHTENDTELVLNPHSVTCFQVLVREMPVHQNLTSLTPHFSMSLNLVGHACHYLGRPALLWTMNQKECMVLPWALSLVNCYPDYTLNGELPINICCF